MNRWIEGDINGRSWPGVIILTFSYTVRVTFKWGRLEGGGWLRKQDCKVADTICMTENVTSISPTGCSRYRYRLDLITPFALFNLTHLLDLV